MSTRASRERARLRFMTGPTQRWTVGVLVAGVALVMSACAPTGAGEPSGGEPVVTPPEDVGFDYQLGGAYAPPDDTGIVVRDSTAAPVAGMYSICYLNAFQTQPGEADDWGDLVLSAGGEPVVDENWPDEVLLDTGSIDAREAIAQRLALDLASCADSGFDAVEFDNLDAYGRSEGALTLADNLALAQLLSEEARTRGLAVAQKNTPEAVAASSDLFDFAIVEDCGAFDECGAYAEAYDVVLDVEYASSDDFADLCEAGIVPATALRRDMGLVPASNGAYAFDRCASAE